ncbi:MAG: apolipoprotein N-acyltransferase [Bacteroidales bacterium]
MTRDFADQSIQSFPFGKFRHLLTLSVLSGLLFTTTLPVRGVPLIAFVALVPLLFAEEIIHRDRSRFRRGSFFLLAFITFLIWNTAGSWWLKNASVFGAVAAVLVNTLLMATVMQLFHGSRKVFTRNHIAYAVLICYWLGFEYFHHNWDLTYPWFSLGNVFSSWPAWVQWYEYTGMPGGSLWILVGNLLVLSLVKDWLPDEQKRRNIFRKSLTVLLWIAVPSIFSIILFHTYSSEGEEFDVVLVQPNNDPYNTQYTIGPLTAVGNFLNLAEPLVDQNTQFVVGPESMIQENIWERHLDRSPSIDSLKSYVSMNPHVTVINGASSFRMIYKDEPITVSAREIDPDFLTGFASYYGVPRDKLSGWYDAYNLGFALDTSGITGMTHKSKLVAGVERMPFKKYLSSIAGDLALDMGGTVGTLAMDEERAVFIHQPSGYKYGVAICYESVFGEFFGRFVKNGADMMFIITNDGWWGNTPGHRQHNAFASLRAIETRRDIARSANTGITCFINQRGEVLQPVEYWVPGAIKGTIKANDTITFYVRYGDYLGKLALFLAVVFLVMQVSYAILPLHRRRSA